MENNFYERDTHRKKGETITLYLRRKNVCWTKLKKEQIDYPDKAKGYITLRDAHLSEKAWV